MRVLVVYCHPVETSYNAALHRVVVDGLRQSGHEVDDCDLYAEGFDPVMSREERIGYHDAPGNRIPVAGYVERLLRAEAVVFSFPTWCFGLPAMLKGFFDRVFMPGVAFDLSDPANVKPSLTHLKHICGVVTYGRPRLAAWYMGDPPRRIVTRYMRLVAGRQARVSYLAHYHLNVATPTQRERFKRKVGDAMRSFA